jgi:UDP-N-acetylmuramate--alanine ligase
VQNSLAAIAVANEMGIDEAVVRKALAGFGGVKRRFTKTGEAGGITVIDDYGHHPTEIRATLAAARACRYAHVHVLFQPHRYTRTAILLDEFARAFHQADTVHVMDIYPASEAPIPGVTAEVLVAKIQAFGHRAAKYVGSMDAGVRSVVNAAASGDAIVTLGAGSVSQAGDRILTALEGRT